MNGAQPKSIAVVVVHGVADQEPKVSARQIANLLTDFTSMYPAGFTEQDIRVPLKPMVNRGGPTPEKNMMANAFSMEERSGTTTVANGDDIAFEFMNEQVRDYEPVPGTVFATVCLEGKRAGSTVHVYEAYWADLSRIGTGLTAFLGELYQLVLHLPSLGRTVVNGERVLRANRPDWRVFSFFQRWLVRFLTLFIAPLNLAMVTFVLPLIATQLETGATVTLTFGAAVGIAALATAAVTGLMLRRWRLPRVIWAIAPFAAATIAMLAAASFIGATTPTHVVMFEFWLISALLIVAVLVSYNERRPGVLGVGGLMLLLFGALFARELARTTDWFLLPQAALRIVEIANTALRSVWFIHVPWLVTTMIVAAVCIIASRTDRARAVRVSWMAIVSVSLATIVFALLTPAFWAAILKGITALIPHDAPFQPMALPDWMRMWPLPPDAKKTVGVWVHHAVVTRASGLFVLYTVLLTAFLIALVWSIFPSILVEARPPRRPRTSKRMVALGQWLSNGLNAIPWAALVLPGGLLLPVALYALRREQISSSAVLWAGGAVLALIAARFWLPGASSALDVALDVDNYLREHPRRSTPRARIAERFTSLLAYIHAAPRHYDATIIIAHSQGSVITADLLRYLKRLGDTSCLGAKPVRFFTMGAPLRQLYARVFSPLYLWMGPDADPGAPSSTISSSALPDPASLGVEMWVNAYRSGDYVGRNLWCNRTLDDVWKHRRDDDARLPPDIDSDAASERVEICIGEGAHTHYWDRNGEDIARVLDDLIAK